MPSRNETKRKKVTANDIARKSGYSLTAVSFAFNRPGRLSDEVREKILKVADELGYVPDPLARKFAMGRHLAIGFLLPQESKYTLSNPYIQGIIRGVVGVCESRSYTLSILPPIKQSIGQAIQNAAVDGFITVGLTITSQIRKSFEVRNLPIVTIGGDINDEIASINIDDEEAGRLIVEKAIERGHREFVFVSLNEPLYSEYYMDSVMQRRIQGYKNALSLHGIEWDEKRVIHVDSSIDGGYDAAKLLFSSSLPHFTCIVSMADIISVGIMRYAAEQGLSIPGDCSLVSFDGIDEALFPYDFTTIVQNPETKGRTAGEKLFDMLDNSLLKSDSILLPFYYREGKTLGECTVKGN